MAKAATTSSSLDPVSAKNSKTTIASVSTIESSSISTTTSTVSTNAFFSQCKECCSCTDDQLVLTDMWNCKYINLVKTFLNQSYYGDRCLAETTEKLFLHNAMFWLFQTNNAPTFPLNEYAGTGCKASTLMDTFPSAVCTDVVCDMIKKLEDLLGSCCTLSEGVEIGYCERGSKGEWEADYNNGLGYQVTDIVFFANQYWRNTIPNNTQSPSNNQVTSGWEICQNV